jgi:Xaa-Pro aminopeptidase
MKTKHNLLLISNSQNEANIHYLCGVRPPETAILLRNHKDLTLLVAEMESNRLRRTVKPNVHVIHPAEIGIKPGGKLSDWISKLLEQKNLQEICVTPDFPVGIADSLRRDGIKLTVTSEPPCPHREIKTADEIKAVQQSQRAAVAAMKAAIQQIASSKIEKDGMLKVGKQTLTSEMVRATINHTLIDYECTAEETIVAGGPLSADPHERGSGPLVAGQPIVIDIFPRSVGRLRAQASDAGKTGYWGDITRTVCRGPAPADLKKQYNAVKAAQAAQLKMLKAGVRADTVHKAGADLMEARGFKTKTIDGVAQGFIHGTGHGVGLEIHEAPRVSPANRKTLRAGHIITIEPGLYYSEIGGIRIEDTVAITKDGYKILASCIKKLEI